MAPRESIFDAAAEVLKTMGHEGVTWRLAPGEWAVSRDRPVRIEQADPKRAHDEGKLFFPIFWLADEIKDHRVETAMALAAALTALKMLAEHGVESVMHSTMLYAGSTEDRQWEYFPNDGGSDKYPALAVWHQLAKDGDTDSVEGRISYALQRASDLYVSDAEEKYLAGESAWISPFQDAQTGVSLLGASPQEFGWRWLKEVPKVADRLPSYESGMAWRW